LSATTRAGMFWGPNVPASDLFFYSGSNHYLMPVAPAP
jgi:hypothetical protein